MNLKITRLHFRYQQRQVLRDIELQVHSGEILALLGPNGAGKTTLLKTISGVLAADSGAIYLDLRELATMSPREIARQVAAVEQEIRVGFDFTVQQIVGLGRLPYQKLFSGNAGPDRAVVRTAMEQTDTCRLAERSIFDLSSGERQRVWLAMALAQQPGILLLDEPTSHLDINYQIEILDLIRKLARQKLTIVMSIHDLNLAARYASRVALLQSGQLVAIGPPRQVLNAELLQKVFGVKAQIIDIGDNSFFIAVIAVNS